jgi:hypothetical protein
LAPYVTYFLFDKLGMDPILSMPFAMAAMFILGYGIQRFIVRIMLIMEYIPRTWTADARCIPKASERYH